MADPVQEFAQEGQDQLANQAGLNTNPPAPPMPTRNPARPASEPAAPANPVDQLAQVAGGAPSTPDQGGGLDDAITQLQRRLSSPDQPTEAPQTPQALQPQIPQVPIQGAAEVQPDQPATTTYGKAFQRLLGTDVNDPLAITRTGTTLSGALLGTYLGSRVPGPPLVKGAAAVAGSAVGTAVGAASPEIVLDALESMGYLKPGTREKMGLSDQNLKTVMEGEALLDLYTAGGLSAARLGARGISNIMTGANRATRAMAEAASREGIAMLPVQVGQRTFARGFVSVMGHFPLIAGAIRRNADRSVDRIANMFQGIPARLGPLSTFDDVSARILREANQTAETIATQYEARANQLFHRADMNFVQVRPVNVRAATDNILAQMRRATPVGTAGEPLAVTKNMSDLRQFLIRQTAGMSQGTEIADQSLRQMDTVLKSIDERMAKYAQGGDTQAMQWLEQLRNGVQMDMVNNVISRRGGPLSVAQQGIVREFRQLDEDMTRQVNELFSNATAHRMGARVSPTIRSARFMDDLNFRQMDDLAQVLVRGGSPQMVDELGRIVSRDAMQRLASATFNDAVQKAVENVPRGTRLDVEILSKELGLDAPGSLKFQQTERLLQHSGGLTMDQLQTMVGIATRASEAEIPNVSSFIARRAVLTGVGNIIPGMAALSGSGMAGGPIGFITLYGGSRLLAGIISNPMSARALSRVFDAEASNIARRAALMKAITTGTIELTKQGIINAPTANGIVLRAREGLDKIDNAVKREQNQ